MAETPRPVHPPYRLFTDERASFAARSHLQGDGTTTASDTVRRLVLVAVVGLLVVPAAHAAEPTAPEERSAVVQGVEGGEPDGEARELYPGSTGFATTFVTKTGNGLDKKNLFGRCVSLTAKKLVAAKRAADQGGPAGATLKTRCAAELAAAAPRTGTSVGASLTGGRQLAVAGPTTDVARPTVGGGGSELRGEREALPPSLRRLVVPRR